MNKPDVRKLARSVSMSLSKHAPGILTGIGIGGLLATTVLAVKATPKALQLIEEEKKRQEEEAERRRYLFIMLLIFAALMTYVSIMAMFENLGIIR